MPPLATTSPFAALAWPEFRRLFLSTAFITLGYRALTLIIGYQVYEITSSTLALGMLGLVEAIPAPSPGAVWRSRS